MIARRLALGLPALLLLGLPARGQPAFRPGDTPPVVAGVALGQSRAEIVRTLGPPERTDVLEPPDSVVRLGWPRKGVAVVVSRLDGAAIVTLSRREAGAIHGIRVGDSLAAVVERWGMPTQRVDGEGVWRVGDWDVIVRPEPANPVVTALTLGWDTSKFAPDAAMAAEREAGRMKLHPIKP